MYAVDSLRNKTTNDMEYTRIKEEIERLSYLHDITPLLKDRREYLKELKHILKNTTKKENQHEKKESQRGVKP